MKLWPTLDPPPPIRWRRTHVAELALVLLVGVAIMRFVFSGTGLGTDRRPTLAGNDCYYHVKMAVLFNEAALPDCFPWLAATFFVDHHVNHRYGFHAYLVPFVQLSHWWTGDYLPGARVAMCVAYGLMLGAAYLVLLAVQARPRWLWLALLAAMPADFVIRLAYTRPTSLSVVCLLLGCFFLFRRRYVWLAVTLVVYTHVYLGSFFLVIVAGIDFISGVLDRRRPRWDWPLVLWVGVGFAVGFATHPHFPANLAFLKAQIFGSGLTPEVQVGREWYPYDDAWKLANLIGVPLCVWSAALALRLRLGNRLNRSEWTLLLAHFFFFALMLKARRFVEYWPVFGLLSAASLASPVLAAWGRHWFGATAPAWRRSALAGLTAVAGGLAMAVLIAGLTGAAAAFGGRLHPAVVTLSRWWPAWVGLGVLLALTYAGATRWRDHGWRRGNATLLAVGVALGAIALWYSAAAIPLQQARQWAKGKYDLDAIEQTLTEVASRSDEGDIIFTDDWDVFPVFFYYNHHNRYLTGLDPVFTYRYDPELRVRYRQISRGQVPSKATVDDWRTDPPTEHEIDVQLSDIRDVFHARFVVVDRDHQTLARLLERNNALAQSIYASPRAEGERQPAYRVFEILPAGE